jgi:hypothetical protein
LYHDLQPTREKILLQMIRSVGPQGYKRSVLRGEELYYFHHDTHDDSTVMNAVRIVYKSEEAARLLSRLAAFTVRMRAVVEVMKAEIKGLEVDDHEHVAAADPVEQGDGASYRGRVRDESDSESESEPSASGVGSARRIMYNGGTYYECKILFTRAYHIPDSYF